MDARALNAKTLLADVHHTLGRAWLAANQAQQAEKHFAQAGQLAGQASTHGEAFPQSSTISTAAQMGLLPEAAQLFKKELDALKKHGAEGDTLARIQVLETELELVQQELRIALQRKQLYHRPGQAAFNAMHPEPKNPEWLDWLKTRAMSQLGQDLWALERTNYKRGGFFVEFGATDGVLLSNTWLLEKEFGWNGILAEPNPKFFEKLQSNRSCQVSNACIGARTGDEVEFVFAAEYGGVKSDLLKGPHTKRTLGYASQEEYCAQLTTISLHDFLLSVHAPRDIDYISIDTEGSEFEILQTFPFPFWNVSLFTIEHNYTEQRSEIHSLMKRNGYFRVEAEFDDWYEKIY